MAEQNERTEKNTKIAQWAFLPNTTLLVGIKHKVQRDLVNRGPCVIEKKFQIQPFFPQHAADEIQCTMHADCKTVTNTSSNLALASC